MTRRDSTFRGIAIFAAAWQGLWIAGDGNLRLIVASNPADPASIALLISMAAWLMLWPSLFGPWRSTGRLRLLQVISMVFVVLAGLILMTETSAVGADGWFVGASVVNLGAGLAGIYLTRRWGVSFVVAIATLQTVVVVFVHADGDDAWPLAVDLVYPFYALALGLASVAARHALMVSALRQDDVERQLTRQEQVRTQNELTGETLASAETRLHETVLNTLTAIVRGGLGDNAFTRERLRERARESADVLTSIAQGSDVAARWDGDLRVDLAGTVADVEDSRIKVEWDGILGLDLLKGQVDQPTFATVGTAVRESLINVLRHSGASKVCISGDIRTAADGRWWRIRIRDDGRGFDIKDRGFGLRTVVEDGIRGCGGRVSIKSNTHTEITLEIPVRGLSASPDTPYRGVLQAITLPVVAAFTALTFYTIGATWEYVGSALLNTVSAGVFLGLVTVVLLAVRDEKRELMPWWAVLSVLVGVPVMTAVERLVVSTPIPTGDWSSEAGAALVFVVVATGPVWAAPAAVVSWFIAQDLQWIELTQPGMFVILIAALLGWQLRRGQARVELMDSEVSHQQVALVASQRKLAHARTRFQAIDTSGLVALLEGISVGSVDPSSSVVRAMCAREERMIRSVLRLHPEVVPTHRDLVLLATTARDCDVDLSIAIVDDIPQGAALTTLEDARGLIRQARPLSQARASITRDNHGCTFRLVVQIGAQGLRSLPSSAEVLDEMAGLVVIEEACRPVPTVVATSVNGEDAQR